MFECLTLIFELHNKPSLVPLVCLNQGQCMNYLPFPLWSHVMVVLQRNWVSQIYIIKIILFVYLCHSYLPFPIITFSLFLLKIISFLSPYPLTWIWKQQINMCLFMAILCIFKRTYFNLFSFHMKDVT
jgi:hypothetical protein